MANVLKCKPLDMLMEEASDTSEHSLKRALGPVNLITLGIGAIIGAGIFVLTGSAAAMYAGPAIVLSFILAGSGCVFAGLCYSEFASLIPIAGSAYTYGYATLGEIFAWIIGWDLVLEYAFGAATVASGWSGYFVSLLQDFGIHIPPQLCATPFTHVGNHWVPNVLVQYQGRWELLTTMAPLLKQNGIDPSTLPHVTGVFNLIAFLAIFVITAILVIGIQESANFNSAIVIIKVTIVLIFIAIAGVFVAKHPGLAVANWHPFIPPNQGSFGEYGWSGIARAAGVIFFAYIGFDAVSTAAQEAKNPQRDMPIGILGSLVICTILYILVSGLLTGIVPYSALNVADPVAVGIDATGVVWGSILVKLGAIAGLGSVMLVMLLGQSRVFYSMSRDGLLPRLGRRRASQVPYSVDFVHHGGNFCGNFRSPGSDRHSGRTGEYWYAAGLRHRMCRSLGVARTPARSAPAFQNSHGAAGADSRHHYFICPDGQLAASIPGCDCSSGW